jgi:hypothetical protein
MTAQLPSAAERLLARLPQIFRIRDFEEATRIAGVQGFPAPDPLDDLAQGPLFTLLAALGQQFDLLEAEVDWLYEDQFIETCADWVVPYIGALVGARIIDVGDALSARMQVASTIRERRAKGTARAIANRTHDVMVSPSEAIEYAAHVSHCWNPNFPGSLPAATTAINGIEGAALGLPGWLGQRVTELRDMREGGRFATFNVGARTWTTPSVGHFQVMPFALSGGEAGRFRFDPLGRDIALWNLPQDPVADRSRLELDQIPGPIPLAAALANPSDYYGSNKSLAVFIGNTLQPLSAICFCDLGDDGGPGQWNHRGDAAEHNRIRIDPARGRFILPAAMAATDPATIRVQYHFGAALKAGGGPREQFTEAAEKAMVSALEHRDRRPQVADFAGAAKILRTTAPAQVATDFKAALDNLAAKPAVLVEFGGFVPPPALTTLGDGGNFEIRGGDEVWPTLPLSGQWVIRGGRGSMLTLRGLRIGGDDIVIRAEGLRQLMLIDCTLVPGSGRIVIEEPACKLIAVRSILGRLRVAPSVEIDLLDSLVDSGDADTAAIAAPDGTAAGIVWSRRSTIVGDVRALAFDEVDDSLFAVRPERSAAGPAVSVQRLQTGCVRYSALPRGSVVPRRYRCFPAESDTVSSAPVFTSLHYGDPAYATLVAANAEALLFGAENGGEPGAANPQSLQRRKRLLDRDLYDWVPFGMSVGTELMSD